VLAENLPVVRPCRVPAPCYNLSQLVRRMARGSVEVRLAGLAENRVLVAEQRWSCWNHRLGTLLLSWEHFRPGLRNGLHEPVDCTLTVHHSYSRTIIHRVYESLAECLHREVQRHRPILGGRVIHWPGTHLG